MANDHGTDFYEEDEPLEKLAAIWAEGPQGLTGAAGGPRRYSTLVTVGCHDQGQPHPEAAAFTLRNSDA
jgi:hypothetical protein